LKVSCDQARTDALQYTDTQVQQDANQLVINACDLVDLAETNANTVVSSANTLTNGVATTVQEILNLAQTTQGHV